MTGPLTQGWAPEAPTANRELLEFFVSTLRREFTLIKGGRSSSAEADPAGRIVRDAKGNAVWDWGLDTVVLATATTADLLKNLARQASPFELVADASTAWAGDPYNRSR